jgi:aminoglycoside phosphotransferase (APT) family kinase protein
VQLLAEGRLAEVYLYGEGRVVKLDRPEWNGVSEFESQVIERLVRAGLPVARSHGTVTLEGRCGVVLDRIEGDSLLSHIVQADGDAIDALAERFVTLQSTINATTIDGFPDLVDRLGAEIAGGRLPEALRRELTDLLARVGTGRRGVCHFDFHPLNVIVAPDGWVVIDWLGVAWGPPLADLARTLVIWGRSEEPPVIDFMRRVRRHGLAQRGADDEACDAWVRVLAGARLAEGFEEAEATWLTEVARGGIRLFV